MSNPRLAPIQPEWLYPLPILQDVAGQGRAALAEARKNGLETRKIGNRKYILGSDFIEHVKKHGSTDAGPNQ